MKFLNDHYFKTRWPSKLIVKLGWASRKGITHSKHHSNSLISWFHLNLKYLNGHHFETRWRTKLILKIITRVLQDVHSYWVSLKSVHKYIFNFNLQFLIDRHFETRGPPKLDVEHRWAFDKDFMHSEFHWNRLINKFLNWIWSFLTAAIWRRDGERSKSTNSIEKFNIYLYTKFHLNRVFTKDAISWQKIRYLYI